MRYIIISELRLIKIAHEIVNVSIKIIPAPRGFPTDLVPLMANARPASRGRMFLPAAMAIHVMAKAKITLKNVISFMYWELIKY